MLPVLVYCTQPLMSKILNACNFRPIHPTNMQHEKQKGNSIYYADPSLCLCIPITNDTSPGPSEVDVWFEPASYTVNEGDGTVTIFIRTNATAGIAEGAVHLHTKDSEVTIITTGSDITLSPATGVLTMHSYTYSISTMSCMQFSIIVLLFCLYVDGTNYSSKLDPS